MVVCPRCGEENPDRAKFCLNCGEALAPAALHEERKLVSILFVDLVAFTAQSDKADPEDVRDKLQLYHSRAREQIERYGGAVDKFIGDAVMAVFGAPIAHADDGERAVRAGLRVLETIEELNRETPGLNLAARAAVNTGEAVVLRSSFSLSSRKVFSESLGRSGPGHSARSSALAISLAAASASSGIQLRLAQPTSSRPHSRRDSSYSAKNPCWRGPSTTACVGASAGRPGPSCAAKPIKNRPSSSGAV